MNAHTEHTVFLNSEFKSVRFDVYALDEDEVSYDVEMQNEHTRNLPKRCRYYQSELDMSALKPGEDCNALKPSYIIFICTFDPFGKGRYRYVFEEYCKDADISLVDETQKIFFYTNGTDRENITPELLQFFTYLKSSTEDVSNMQKDERIQKIHERVTYLKRNRELEAGYMTMEEYIHEEAGRRAERMAKDMAQNMAKDMADSQIQRTLLTFLSDLSPVSDELKSKIESEKNADTLTLWLKLAARSESIKHKTFSVSLDITERMLHDILVLCDSRCSESFLPSIIRSICSSSASNRSPRWHFSFASIPSNFFAYWLQLSILPSTFNTIIAIFASL